MMEHPRRLIAAAVFACVLFVYLISMPIAAPATGDGASEVHRAAHPVARPHHLLISHTFHYVQSAARRLGYSGPDFIPLQVMNATLGAASAALFGMVLGNFGVSPSVSVLASLLMAFSNAHMSHSREAETFIPSQSLYLTALWAVSALRPVKVLMLRATLAGVLTALAVLHSIYYVLIVPALGVLLLATARSCGRVWSLAAFAIPFALLTLVPYALVVRSAATPLRPGPILTWLTHHPDEVGLAESKQLSVNNALRAATGLVNAFIGDTAVTTAGKQLLKGESRIEVPRSDWLRFILGCLLVLFALAYMIRVVRLGMWAEQVQAAGAVFLCTGAFNIFWLGSDPQFWLPAMPSALILWSLAGSVPTSGPRSWPIGPGISSRKVAKRMHLTLLLASVAVVFAANVRSPVPTLVDRSGGPEWRLAQAFSEMVDRDDLLLSAGSWSQYVRAQQSCSTLALVSVPGRGEMYRQNLERSIDEALDRASRVYALEIFEVKTARAVGGWEEIESRSGLRRKELVEGLAASYRVEPARSELHGRTLWRIERRDGEAAAESRRLGRS